MRRRKHLTIKFQLEQVTSLRTDRLASTFPSFWSKCCTPLVLLLRSHCKGCLRNSSPALMQIEFCRRRETYFEEHYLTKIISWKRRLTLRSKVANPSVW